MRIVNSLSEAVVRGWEYLLNTGKVVDQRNWQGVKAPRPMFEALDYDFKCPMPQNKSKSLELLKPNLPWADEHFLERVGGEPLNPPPSHKIWPFANNSNEAFQKDDKFDHTYPERMWPKFAGETPPDLGLYSEDDFLRDNKLVNTGIRFEYGDLQDVVSKLQQDPTTRQAFLPIWFPEDTGKPDNIRVPCSIGYHFIIRDGRLDITYWMRSLDMIRHFQDDLYLCWRLAKWVWDQVETSNSSPIRYLGYMKFHAVSCHIFDGEQKLLEIRINKWRHDNI